MTTREALHQLVDDLADEEVDALARVALLLLVPREPDERAVESPCDQTCLDARDYPVLAELWDNEQDAIFDELYGDI